MHGRLTIFYWLFSGRFFGLSTKFGHSIPEPLDLDGHSVKRPLSSKYDMNVYMATLLGGEAHDLS
jgi:hypothetical protein